MKVTCRLINGTPCGRSNVGVDGGWLMVICNAKHLSYTLVNTSFSGIFVAVDYVVTRWILTEGVSY